MKPILHETKGNMKINIKNKAKICNLGPKILDSITCYLGLPPKHFFSIFCIIAPWSKSIETTGKAYIG